MAEHIGVCVIVLDKTKKQILLGKRLNSFKAGMLGLPGGRLELKEPLEVGAARELTEETSLKPKQLEYVGVIRELQADYNYIHFVYSCSEFDGTPVTVEPEKCAGWEWYPLDNLPENILSGHKAALTIYLQKIPLKQVLTRDYEF
jgi:8-oxo-dGTP diphosphatase